MCVTVSIAKTFRLESNQLARQAGVQYHYWTVSLHAVQVGQKLTTSHTNTRVTVCKTTKLDL